MSSGQNGVVFNNLERLVSDDHNTMQNFVAKNRSDILQALLAIDSDGWRQSGVSIPGGTAAATPLGGFVLDGLEMIVDYPGSILVSAGVLACWNGNPINSVEDSGFVVVVDDGIPAIGVLTIAENLGTAPRCDVIECQPNLDSSVTNQNRDVFNESTEEFLAVSVPKFKKSTISYRVRSGTPGVPPGYAAGWMPIGLAIVQPGSSLATIDFYDVRPLWRELAGMKSAVNSNSMPGFVEQSPMSQASVVYSDTTAVLMGQSWAEFSGIRAGGLLRRNTPITPLEFANFGSGDVGGGDDNYFTFGPTTALRGSTWSRAANDVVVISAWFPNLGGSVYLPRCVRYCEAFTAGIVPATPARRKPYGPNGILLATTIAQDPMYAQMYTDHAINATGIAGCLGSGIGIPVAMSAIMYTGTDIMASNKSGLGLTQWNSGGPVVPFAILADHSWLQLDLNSGGPLSKLNFKTLRIRCYLVLLGATTDNAYVGVQASVYTSALGTVPTNPDLGLNTVHIGSYNVSGYAHHGGVAKQVLVDFDFEVDGFARNSIGQLPQYVYIHFSSDLEAYTVQTSGTNSVLVTGIAL